MPIQIQIAPPFFLYMIADINRQKQKIIILYRMQDKTHKQHQQYSKHPNIDSVIHAILDAAVEAEQLIRKTVVHKAGTTNPFGDQQLYLDIECDSIIRKLSLDVYMQHLIKTGNVGAISSEQEPFWVDFGDGDLAATYDPLDGSSVVDTNCSIGSIFAIWRKDQRKLIGAKMGEALNGIFIIYGPRLTCMFYNDIQEVVQQLTCIDGKWIMTESTILVAPTSTIFTPGNVRAGQDNKEYLQAINKWVTRGMTLRYSGGLVLDIAQVFVKGQGVYAVVGSQKHKNKIRVLYEVAAVCFLMQKAGGRAVCRNHKDAMQYVIKTYEDTLEFAAGGVKEIDQIQHLFLN